VRHSPTFPSALFTFHPPQAGLLTDGPSALGDNTADLSVLTSWLPDALASVLFGRGRTAREQVYELE